MGWEYEASVKKTKRTLTFALFTAASYWQLIVQCINQDNAPRDWEVWLPFVMSSNITLGLVPGVNSKTRTRLVLNQ